MRHIGLEKDIAVMFLYLIGFYLAMLAFGISPWLALVGAVGFGLGSYNIIIIEAFINRLDPFFCDSKLSLCNIVNSASNISKERICIPTYIYPYSE